VSGERREEREERERSGPLAPTPRAPPVPHFSVSLSLSLSLSLSERAVSTSLLFDALSAPERAALLHSMRPVREERREGERE
jgi:hypothetical protein